MPIPIERWTANAVEAKTEDLLDRATVLRAGIEPEALELIEKELRRRGVTDEQVQEYGARRECEVIWREPGLAWTCSYCARPAVVWERDWVRLFWLVPIFPRWVRCCPDHRRD